MTEEEHRPWSGRIAVFAFVFLGVTNLGIAVWSLASQEWLDAVPATVTAFVMLMWVKGTGLAFRDGYHRGRVSWVFSMMEAQQRGLSLKEWLYAEMERESARLDIPPPPSGLFDSDSRDDQDDP